jgi:hypothetical protein
MQVGWTSYLSIYVGKPSTMCYDAKCVHNQIQQRLMKASLLANQPSAWDTDSMKTSHSSQIQTLHEDRKVQKLIDRIKLKLQANPSISKQTQARRAVPRLAVNGQCSALIE